MPKIISQFWQELKRRGVIKVITMYAATAFIIMEAAEIILPRLGLPDWTVTFLIILLIVGFPITIILSWIFDITPEGVTKTEAAVDTETAFPTEASKRKLKASDVIISVLVVVVCVLIYPKIFNRDPLTNLRDSDGSISVAVMPFDNLTGESSNDVWQNGISEYLINDLGSSEELSVLTTQVIFEVLSSTNQVSSASISPTIARETASKVNASTYITGNFIGSVNNASILLNLVGSGKGEMIWSCRVEGDLENHYQDVLRHLADTLRNYLEIKALEDRVSPELSLAFPNSSEAYRHYITGVNAMLAFDEETARASLIRAMDIDSTFTLAAFYLAWVSLMLNNSDEKAFWIYRAHELKYNLPLEYQTWIDLWYTFLNKDMEELRRVCSIMERSDIQSRLYWFDLATTYYAFLWDYEKAVEVFQKVEEINIQWKDDWIFASYYGIYVASLLRAGQLDEMDRLAEKALEMNLEDWYLFVGMGAKSLLLKDNEAFEKYKDLVREMNKGDINPEASNAHDIGMMYEWIEDYHTAKGYFQNAYELDPSRNFSLYFMIRSDLLDNGSPEENLGLIYSELLRNPENTRLIWLKGYALHKLNRNEEALVFLKEAEEMMMFNAQLKEDIREVELALDL